MELNFNGKTVVVTGAASGIGRAVASGFSRPIQTCVCNVSEEQEVAALLHHPLLANGVDVFVHCAGITYQRAFTETSTEEYRRLVDVNLTGTFFCLRESIAGMKAHEIQGSIIVISSINAHRTHGRA